MKKILKNKWTYVITITAILLVILIVFTLKKGTSILIPGVKITPSETKQIELVDYDSTNFTMKIPRGWKVETCGEGMYFSIRVYDPNDGRFQIFSILKAEPFLKNSKAKAWYENYYKLFGGVGNKLLAKAVVLYTPTVTAFYENFNNYINYTKEVSTASVFNAPVLDNLQVIEEYKNDSLMGAYSKDDKIIRATFNDDSGKTGEGLFMGTLVDQGSNNTLGYDTLFYTVYNVIGISSAEYELVNYEELLTKSLNSLAYKDSFVNETIKNIEIQTENTLKINATVQAAFDSYNNAWTARQNTYDITSQKYSDATLGYQRVYDKENGDIYKAYNGFIDDYKGDRYVEITDDMYTKPISGYIEK